MNGSLRIFTTQYLGACAGVMVLVVLVAFVSIPFSLRAHPGETLSATALIAQHIN